MNEETFHTFLVSPTRLFKETIQEHQQYFFEHDNTIDWIENWGRSVVSLAQTLAIFPFRYRVIRGTIRRLKLNKKYSILYRVDEKNSTVYVLGCVHMGWQLSEFFDRIEAKESESV
ncbi:hypothetical protein KA050_04070 [Candidatus Gracilibacteria bacterium]|nr:hypothetical protein [Candidatus Gracilibacteria bacterium]